MPPETPTLEDRSTAILDKMLGAETEDEIPQDTPPTDDTPPSDEEEDESPPPSDEEEEIDDSVEEDYEESITSKKKKEIPEDVDLDKVTETVARKMAKENGQKAKLLDTQLKEKDLELTREREAREGLEARLAELEVTKINPQDHPDFVALYDEIMSDVKAVALRLPTASKTKLTGKTFGSLMANYIALTSAEGDEVVAADEALNAAIVDNLGFSEMAYAELDEEERSTLQPRIDKIVDLLERNSSKNTKLNELNRELTLKAQSGHLAVGVRAYEDTVKSFTPVLDAVGELADDLIEANPYAVESIVARMVKENPSASKRLASAKRDVLEVLVGPRALTQAEIDKMQTAGTNVKEFLVERNKAHKAKQLKFAAMFVQDLMLRGEAKAAFTELAQLKKSKDAEEEEFDVLAKTKKKPAPRPPDKNERKDPLRFLGDEGLD